MAESPLEEDSATESFLSNPELLRPLTRARRESDLSQLSRAELESRCVALEKHVQQLRNVIAKQSNSALPEVQVKSRGQKFDFSRFARRHILLRVAYFGWDYMGFATQEDAGKSIESELFAALLRTKMVSSRKEANYHRCGRTDRGVSATGQVISLDVRTNLVSGEGVFHQEGYTGPSSAVGDEKEEIDFCNILNRNLPQDIRVTGWCPAPKLDFSARFDCSGRSYQYTFPRAGLDISKMEAAGQRLVGVHDFRNLAKMDVGNGVVKYVRRIDSLTVTCVKREGERESPYDLCQVSISSKAFLWHQIRCIMALLFLVGEGLEEETVISELLDVSAMPCRPAYSMASDLPLNLHHTEFSGIDFRISEQSLQHVIETTQTFWAQLAVKAGMVRQHLEALESLATQTVIAQVDRLTGRRKEKSYTPLLELPRCPSLEDKIKSVVKRRKLDTDVKEVELDEFDDSQSD